MPACAKGTPVFANAGSFGSGLFLAALVLVLLGGVLLLVARLLFAGTGRRVRSCFWARSLNAVQGKLRARRPGWSAGGISAGQVGDCILYGGMISALCMLAWCRLPSLHSYDTCMEPVSCRAHRGTSGQKYRETYLPPFGVFFVSRIFLSKFWDKMLWHLWIGRARHPGPGPNDLDIEVFNAGGFLTLGDYAFETDAGFLAVIEHRLIPARIRHEWARLRRAGIWSVWSPANQDFGHVGHAGVGLICLKGCLPLFLHRVGL